LFYSTSTNRLSHNGSSSLIRRAAAFALVTIDLLMQWLERNKQRRQLMAMSHHQLKDIGLTQSQVYREANKPFWKE